MNDVTSSRDSTAHMPRVLVQEIFGSDRYPAVQISV